MSKIIKSNNVLLSFILSSVFVTTLSIVIFISIFSFVILKFDLGNIFYEIVGAATVGITSFLCPLFSTRKLNNNLFLMSILSNSLLIFITIINTIFNKNILLIIIEIIMVVLFSFIASTINANRSSNNFRV